jgi:beta-lactam-binding protein with PASTA domain
MVEVPNTIGMTRPEAESTLTSAGFNVLVNLVPGPPGDVGKVTNQSPASGEAAPGSTVTIFVGS